MIKKLFFLVPLLVSFSLLSQQITGPWNGVLKVPRAQLRLVFTINNTQNGYAATMDSPDQNAKGIPVTNTSFDNSILKFVIPNATIRYEGTWDNENHIVGKFSQGGQSFVLNLSRGNVETKEIVRIQEPQKPYSYTSEEVVFANQNGKTVLAGTLTFPRNEGPFPAVILISGSGPNNRDEEHAGHKPFLVLADYLTQKGIAVLRFDKRGIAKSTGDYKAATTLDFANDVHAGVDYLLTRKEIDNSKIGLIGHSEGGVIAPIVASDSKNIDFIVLLAGTGIRSDKLMLLQKELIERQMGIPENEIQRGQEIFKGAYEMILTSTANDSILKTQVNSYFKVQFGILMNEGQINALTSQITSAWFYDFLKFDPALVLEKVECPVLALNGAKDLQVPADVNLAAIKKALTTGGNKKVTTTIIPNLNHQFQESKTGSPDEYATIEQTFSPVALAEISKWVLLQVK